MSAGQNLTVKFRANDEYANAGFRAKYTFVNYPDKYWFNKPNTDCGGKEFSMPLTAKCVMQVLHGYAILIISLSPCCKETVTMIFNPCQPNQCPNNGLYWLTTNRSIITGIVDDTGGAITMMNMVAQTGTSRAYDCVWLVKSSARETPESQISIRVAQFEEMGM